MHYERVSNRDSSWWDCISKAEQKSKAALQKEMREALLAVTDPSTLVALGLLERASASPSELQCTIQQYLTSKHFCTFVHGGEQEMKLLSFVRTGDQSFSAVKLQHDLTRSIEATA